MTNSATKQINTKIVGYAVKANDVPQPGETTNNSDDSIVRMHESVERPEMLVGSTYKLKSPTIKHALYITINNIVLNEGTKHERQRPYEIFISSINMDNFQWVVALTRLISAVFRKGGDIKFLTDELKEIFDPQGGYFNNGVFKSSLVAEIGEIIERHLQMIGVIPPKELDEHQKAFIEAKKAEFHDANKTQGAYPETATLCKACGEKAVVVSDGCPTCWACGDSKCSG